MGINSCLAKQEALIASFKACSSKESLYQKIMEMGRSLAIMPEKGKAPEFLVSGCQSEMYFYAEEQDGVFHLFADSEALISKGLAALIIYVYNGEAKESILIHPPIFLQELQLGTLLTPGRSNGLAGLLMHLKKLAVRALTPA